MGCQSLKRPSPQAVNELGEINVYVAILTHFDEAFMIKHICTDLFTLVDICPVVKWDNHFSCLFFF